MGGLVWGGLVLIAQGKPLGLLFVGLFGAGALVGTAALVRGRPRLILSRDGLEFASALGRRRWDWADVGVFEVSEQEVHRRFLRPMKVYWAVAFTDRNHDMLQAAGKRVAPGLQDADIKILLAALHAGCSRTTAEAVVADLNWFRAWYGRPEVEVDTDDLAGEVRALERRGEGRMIVGAFFIALSPIILAVLWLLGRAFG